LEKSRNAEVERGNLAKFLTKQSIYVTAAEMDDTIDIRRRKLEVEALQREEALETLTRTAQLEGRRKAFEQAQESALAAELEATRREEESRRREIQRICEADPSLRILQVRRVGVCRHRARRALNHPPPHTLPPPSHTSLFPPSYHPHPHSPPFPLCSPNCKWRTSKRSAACSW
jgi:hypothetical protein